MKKRIGSCFVLFIFLVSISLWMREEGKEEGAKERVREAADEFHGEDKGSTTENKESIQRVKDERDSIYEPAAHAYEEIRSLYHLDYEYVDVNDLKHHEIEFVHDKTYEEIKKAYEEINFYGEIERGDKERYGFYLEKFHLLLEEKVKFTLPERLKNPYTEETQFYLSEYEELYINSNNGRFAPEDYLYYFFDMNGDNNPELCIAKEIGRGFVYIFQYKEETDEIILWYELGNGYYSLIGTKKVGFDSSYMDGSNHGYYELNEEGNKESEVWFYSLFKTETGEMIYVYMVDLPEYSDEDKNQKIRESIEETPYIKGYNHIKLYRVTKEQYEELTSDYFESLELGKEKRKEVTYTYEELFHDEIEFVSDEKFKEINNAYKEIDFFGEFEQGDKEKKEYYQEKFHQLLKGEVKFTLSKEANEYYLRETQYSLNEYLGLKTYPGNEEELTFVPEDHLYYFYDINKDGIPELCINPKEGKRYYYIFQYIEERDEIILRHKRYKSYYPFMGTKKTTCHIPGTIKDYYQFYEQGEEGEKEREVTFYKAYRMKQGEWEEEYMVEMPYDYEKEIKGNREEERLYGTRSSQSTYYRVTKEQYEELTNPFFQALEKAEENLKQVTYTYEELFGEKV